MAHTYAALGKKVYLYEDPNGKKKHRQVLWGDWLEIDDQRPKTNGFVPIVWAKKSPEHRKELWIKQYETTEEQPLEIVFVDVGQGDGSVLITPEPGEDERVVVVDAGEGDHMHRFLRGRFHAYRGLGFDAAVVTHPDKDHYFGFRGIFSDPEVGFERVYHNGLMELPVRGGFEKLGGTTRDEALGITFVNHLWEDHDEVVANFSDASTMGDFDYPRVINEAIKNPKIKRFEPLSTRHGERRGDRCYMPGFAPSADRGYAIEVLGPYVEEDSSGAARLRKLGNSSKTKNGHSVLLRLTIGKFSVFFGGDLNQQAEQFLIRKYTGQEDLPEGPGPLYEAVRAKARERFRSEVMKCCHHGAADVTDLFLDSVNPACFVISSGDQEGHVHPRPDLLGRLGRFGRGESPVLLSTELQRSTREREDAKQTERLKKLVERIADNPTPHRLSQAQEQIELLAKNNVEVYGAIYVKTDGKRLITAFRIETNSMIKRWFYFEYLIDSLGMLKVED